MLFMNRKIKEQIRQSLSSVLPVSLLVLLISIFLVPIEVGATLIFICGTVLLVIGMGFFELGAEMAMSPLGDGIGMSLARSRSLPFILGTIGIIGAVITMAEPDLQVLAFQVPAIPDLLLISTVAVGVGVFLALAVFRIIRKTSLRLVLTVMYLALILLAFLVPGKFLSVAFDSGGVTTGPMTVPFIMALGIGISSMRLDRDSESDSFGLIALASGGPILAVMILGIIFRSDSSAAPEIIIPEVLTTRDVVMTFAAAIPHYIREVAVSILPLFALFLLFQLLSRRFSRVQLLRIVFGFLYTSVGLILFLCGVSTGFSPIGSLLGQKVAGIWNGWPLIPFGMAVGYFIVRAEPAIQILNRQVQSITDGAVSEHTMNSCLSIGVALAVGLSMARVLFSIPLIWIVVPGYVLALVLAWIVPDIFVGIAFDSGGVASGPMTSTFLLPLCIGACMTRGGSIMEDAFGIVSLVALTPLIAIQIMGVVFRIRTARSGVHPSKISPLREDGFILFEEDDGKKGKEAVTDGTQD